RRHLQQPLAGVGGPRASARLRPAHRRALRSAARPVPEPLSPPRRGSRDGERRPRPTAEGPRPDQELAGPQRRRLSLHLACPPRLSMDGGASADHTRALMQFLTATITTSSCNDANAENTPGCGAWIKKQERDFEDIRTFVESIEPPAFPRSSDPASPQYVDAA